MANCAPYAKRIYSFICSLNCYRNMMHKKFLKLHVKGRLAHSLDGTGMIVVLHG